MSLWCERRDDIEGYSVTWLWEAYIVVMMQVPILIHNNIHCLAVRFANEIINNPDQTCNKL